MIFRRLFVQTFALFVLSIYGRTAIADHGAKLQITVSSVVYTEVLIVENREGAVKWSFVTPQSGEIRGEITSLDSSFEDTFNSIIKMQSVDSQRQRLKTASAFKPTFVLLLSSETQRITWPLTDEEHRKLASSDFMQAILANLIERQLLRKPQLLMDLFYPDRRANLSDPNAKSQYREASPDDTPWHEGSKGTPRKREGGS